MSRFIILASAVVLLPTGALAQDAEQWSTAWSDTDADGDQGPWPSSLDLLNVRYLTGDSKLAIELDFASAESARASYGLGFNANGALHSLSCNAGPGSPLGEPPPRCYGSKTNAAGERIPYQDNPIIYRTSPTTLRIVFDSEEAGAATAAFTIAPAWVTISPTVAVTVPTYSETNVAKADEHASDGSTFDVPAMVEPEVIQESGDAPPPAAKEAPLNILAMLAVGLLVATYVVRSHRPR